MPRRPAPMLAAALCTALLLAGTSAAHAQWTLDYTVHYESSGSRPGKPGERRGPDTLVHEKASWRLMQEVRGTLDYTQKVRGAAASRMPDANNEQRYDSWLFRPGSRGRPAALKIDGEEVVETAVTLGRADGEGAGELNRERAGKFGRVQHTRQRIAVAGEGEGTARLAGAFLQIDRVDGKLHFEPPGVEFDSAAVKAVAERVARMDKAAPAGEWDRSTPPAGGIPVNLRMPALPVQVFDMAAGAQEFTTTRTIDVPGQWPGRATITLALRAGRSGKPVGAATAAPVAAAAAKPAPATEPCAPKSAATPPTAADAGTTVGGAVLGGGYARQVGGAVGGLLGALGGGARKPEPAAQDCPR